ncbi:MAG: protein ImuB [Myxococcota bacterium]|jgi:protein ImuB
MDRLACVEVYALPLQLVLKQAPEWSDKPVAVVDEDRPQGTILWVNEHAREDRVLPGQRYANALSLSRELRASVVPPEAIGAAVAELTQVLRGFTPNVEPSADEPGVFWLDATGLGRLYASLDVWAIAIESALRLRGFRAAILVAFSRFGSYALAKSTTKTRVLPTVESERDAVAEVPLNRLGLSAQTRDRLDRLGVRTVGGFVALPAAGLLKRYGSEAYALYRLAKGELFTPLDAVQPIEPAAAVAELEFIERDAHRLLFRLKRLLDDIIDIVAARQAVIADLRMVLEFDGKTHTNFRQTYHFRPAAPTLDAALLIDLVRLRLETVDLTTGVVEAQLSAQETPATADQLRLFALAPRRDLDAANRALARVRADLGDDAVGTYALREGHLPKAQFSFVPFQELSPPHTYQEPSRPVLVRRLLSRPMPLPIRPASVRHDGWQPRERAQGPIVVVDGPFIVSGGWWHQEVHRAYHFAETQRGDLLWVFYDRHRRAWFEQGRVE